ncbi:hypothetical protein MKW98_020662 [Papaver atlanticum]|uniref:Uncharacterized protein n=1 Tax=Papaver atlanticum TaxID=357466 RepID=A0AAD4TIE3_9MAGN|nr:hypothetical protein MKW98_020662 [Papaver atlanticum]
MLWPNLSSQQDLFFQIAFQQFNSLNQFNSLSAVPIVTTIGFLRYFLARRSTAGSIVALNILIKNNMITLRSAVHVSNHLVELMDGGVHVWSLCVEQAETKSLRSAVHISKILMELMNYGGVRNNLHESLPDTVEGERQVNKVIANCASVEVRICLKLCLFAFTLLNLMLIGFYFCYLV